MQTMSRPVAMVSLDGGGVRGISSLLILERLLELVTQHLVDRGILADDHPILDPQDIFDFAVGTSTGGLIALMLVKLDMAVKECLEQYQSLSKQIFQKERPLWRRLFGSDISKYSASRLQTAVEGLLSRKSLPPELAIRQSSQNNTMQGSVLSHEIPSLETRFFCTNECCGPYQLNMMNSDLQLRYAARATSAAPSYFKPMTIQGRQFVDGGYGETNNPSWAAWLHYKQNHNLTSDRTLVMINIGTGTCSKFDLNSQKQRRPFWTKFIPNGIVSALGLMADLSKMATESEGPTSRLWYIADNNPEQLFLERFSADTGIDTIKLDDWQAATSSDRPSVIATKTDAYLQKPEVLDRLERAARALADVYIYHQAVLRGEECEMAFVANRQPQSFYEVATTTMPTESSVAGHNPLSCRISSNRTPSLVLPTEPTQSPPSSPPRTPKPARAIKNLSISIEHTSSLLQGQGEQFSDVQKSSHPSSPPSGPMRLNSRQPRRSLTYPLLLPSDRPWNDDGDDD
ncbi:hypothetical protein LTR84_011728 [Exophiala bonariae]|uniref:PNPLA domain-containing protein n=1 Tax=Exophiala bonariae TaxID=1690606 RepID=A0AAV9NGT5_9EURO|nr:hypothetical protein LTR84_011728 [Exophiala bonariae]